MTDASKSAHFPTTHWSRVIAAGDLAAPESRAALSELCAAYWYPIYAMIRRRGNAPQEACDLAQDYFTRLLEKPVIAAADQSKGRFRAFLKTDCQHFLIDHHRKEAVRAHVLKPVSIDADDAETRYRFEPADDTTPDRLFDRTWATTLLDRVLGLLAHEYAQTGRAEVFERLKVLLSQGKGAVPAAELAANSEPRQVPCTLRCTGSGNAIARSSSKKSPPHSTTRPRWMKRSGGFSRRFAREYEFPVRFPSGSRMRRRQNRIPSR